MPADEDPRHDLPTVVNCLAIAIVLLVLVIFTARGCAVSDPAVDRLCPVRTVPMPPYPTNLRGF